MLTVSIVKRRRTIDVVATALLMVVAMSSSCCRSSACAFQPAATMKNRPSERPNHNLRQRLDPHNVRMQQQKHRALLPSSSSSSSIISSTTTLGMVKGIANNIDDEYPTEPQVYPQRWTQLAYLSILALLSDWICFSVAASPDGFETAYPGASASSLIDIFLFTNVASCFLVTDVVAKFGLGRSIKGAAGIMTCGCLLRSGLPDPSLYLHSLSSSTGIIPGGSWMANAIDVIESISTSHIQLAYKAIDILPDRIEALVDTSTLTEASKAAGLEPYTLLVIGTILVGFAQPYFQCTPPRLSATWFASDERASATATALNFNQIGIAVAFLVGGQMGQNESGIHDYFNLITLLCVAVTVGTVLQFRDKPQSPPSYSEIEKLVRGVVEPPFLVSARKLFNTQGFKVPLAAFICSISITNIVGTFIDDVMEMGGITDQLGVDLAGAGFELAILVGGIVIGGYVDETKKYKPVTLACLLATMFFVVPLGLTDHMLGNEPVLLVLALLGLGLACGPIQPINAELAVDVTYPCDETAVESVQQVGGNLVSALMVPVAEWALHQDYEFFCQIRPLDLDIRGDVMLMFALAAVTIVYFTTFDAPLRRTMTDDGDR